VILAYVWRSYHYAYNPNPKEETICVSTERRTQPSTLVAVLKAREVPTARAIYQVFECLTRYYTIPVSQEWA